VTAVSIVVPTRNRPAALRRCLDALALQRGVDQLEIVVVDDASAQTAEVTDAVRSQRFARLVRAGGAGPAAARNAGVAAATGDVICFTDDDCVPEPEWASALAGAIEGGADVAGGVTTNGCVDDPFVEASELIVRLLQTSTHRRLGASGRVFIPSNNLACRRSVVLAHPFDETYTRAGGEDRAWCAAVAAAAWTLVLEPKAVLSHHPVLGFSGFWRQHVRYGRGAFRFARTQRLGEWQEPPSFYFELLRRSSATGARCVALVLLSQVATTVGYVAEMATYRP